MATKPEAESHNSELAQNPRDAPLIENLKYLLVLPTTATFKDIDYQPVIDAMTAYISDKKDWERYAHRDKTQGFTRNLVDKGNGKYNLLILVWTPGKESPIHDHAGSRCVMKMLQGCLEEVQYEWPDGLNEDRASPLKAKKISSLRQDDVTYISDEHGLHKLSNMDPEVYAVSLHLYVPPNAAKNGCDVFDANTGRATHVAHNDLRSEMGRLKSNQC
ncbi:hypothetical protein MMC21_002204 [Puttea exsequens]|nr:hypothetical protein [Puttea exsequens]